MKATIHEAHTLPHPQTSPPTSQLVFRGDTLQETVDFLARNGGGVYRNVLHGFQFRVAVAGEIRE
jgi:hypothetical protein